MKLTFRTQAERDLRWFSFYYANRFPEGRRKAERHWRKAVELLLALPMAGQFLDGVEARRLPVLHTPFVIVYTVVGDTVDILRVWDARSDPEGLSEN